MDEGKFFKAHLLHAGMQLELYRTTRNPTYAIAVVNFVSIYSNTAVSDYALCKQLGIKLTDFIQLAWWHENQYRWI